MILLQKREKQPKTEDTDDGCLNQVLRSDWKTAFGNAGRKVYRQKKAQYGLITNIWVQHKKAAPICKCKASKKTCLVRDRGLLSKDSVFKATAKHLRGTLLAEGPRENEPTVTELPALRREE